MEIKITVQPGTVSFTTESVTIPATAANIAALKEQIAAIEKQQQEPQTLADCWKMLAARTGERHFIDLFGVLKHDLRSNKYDINSYPTSKRPRQLIALMQLMQVADALNGEDAYYGPGFVLVQRRKGESVAIIQISNTTHLYSGEIIFKTEGFAEKALNILGEKTVKEALSDFEKE